VAGYGRARHTIALAGFAFIQRQTSESYDNLTAHAIRLYGECGRKKYAKQLWRRVPVDVYYGAACFMP
jgi:hypothetical protein